MYQPEDTLTLPLTRSVASPTTAPPRPRRVLWLAPWPYQYHAYMHPVPWIVSLAERLAALPEDIHLTIVNWEEGLATPEERFERNGIQFIFLKTPRSRTDILTLYRWRVSHIADWLRRNYDQYDLIHLHGSELQLPAMVAGLPQHSIPVLLSVQGLVSECVKYVPEMSWYKALWTLAGYYERRYLPYIHHFICRTDWDKAHVARLSPGANIYHNWEILRAEFYEAAQLPLPVPDTAHQPRILFVGGHQVMKGFREALAVFAQLRSHIPGLRLVVAGTVGVKEWTEETQRAHLSGQAADEVERIGFQTAAQLAELCRTCFCLLHPSYIDNSPNTVCEAQIAGLPVVASDVGGLRSLITDGQTGLLSSLKTSDLATQVLRLYHHPALRHRLAAAARAEAQRRHDPATIVQRTLELYRTLTPVS
jgi:glycosyltransferase involved in cell wall biosynthesis